MQGLTSMKTAKTLRFYICGMRLLVMKILYVINPPIKSNMRQYVDMVTALLP